MKAYYIIKTGWGLMDERQYVSAAELGMSTNYFLSLEDAQQAASKLTAFGSDFGKGWNGAYKIVQEDLYDQKFIESEMRRIIQERDKPKKSIFG